MKHSINLSRKSIQSLHDSIASTVIDAKDVPNVICASFCNKVFVLQLFFVFVLFFVHGNILFFVMFFVVLYMTAVHKICDVLLPLCMTSYLHLRKIPRIPLGVLELEFPQYYYLPSFN